MVVRRDKECEIAFTKHPSDCVQVQSVIDDEGRPIAYDVSLVGDITTDELAPLTFLADGSREVTVEISVAKTEE